ATASVAAPAAARPRSMQPIAWCRAGPGQAGPGTGRPPRKSPAALLAAEDADAPPVPLPAILVRPTGGAVPRAVPADRRSRLRPASGQPATAEWPQAAPVVRRTAK